MDKQKQIEEMNQSKALHGALSCSGKIFGMMCDNCKFINSCIRQDRSEALYNEGYRKIPKNAVVLETSVYESLEIKNYRDVISEQVRKETAEKFAERLREQYPPRTDKRCTLDDCYMLDRIDEIFKEITEDKDGQT
jgi:hypothetical protein